MIIDLKSRIYAMFLTCFFLLVQNLIKKIVLLNKNHRDQIAVELGKIKQLQVELSRVKEINDKLEKKMEKLKYQSYGGRRSYIWGAGQPLLTPSG